MNCTRNKNGNKGTNAACATIHGRRVAMATICDQRRSCKAADIDRTLSCYAALSLQLLNLAAIPHAIGCATRSFVASLRQCGRFHGWWYSLSMVHYYIYRHIHIHIYIEKNGRLCRLLEFSVRTNFAYYCGKFPHYTGMDGHASWNIHCIKHQAYAKKSRELLPPPPLSPNTLY